MTRSYSTFRELADAWLATQAGRLTEGSLTRYRHALDSVAPAIGTLNGGIGADVTDWARKRRQTASPATFNLELGTLEAVLQWGMAQGKPKSNPATLIQPQRVVKAAVAVPSREELAKLIAKLRETGGKDVADAIEIVVYSGCRRNEARALTWQDVDTAAGTLTIGRTGNTKSGQCRVIPLFAPLKTLLEGIRQERGEADCAPTDRLIRAHDLRQRLYTACDALGLTHYHAWHCWRHVFCSRAMESGVDAPTVAVWAGHQDGGALLLKTYNHVAGDHAKAMAERIR